MDLNRRRWLLVGAIVATGLLSVLLAAVAFRESQSSSLGDVAVSTRFAGWTSVALVAGSLALLSLQVAHVMRRRTRTVQLPRRRPDRPNRP